jgi:hypothetical protein
MVVPGQRDIAEKLQAAHKKLQGLHYAMMHCKDETGRYGHV